MAEVSIAFLSSIIGNGEVSVENSAPENAMVKPRQKLHEVTS
jgi:hypothetical protein